MSTFSRSRLLGVWLILALLVLSALPLAADSSDGAVFASLRVYEGVDPADQAEITRRVAAGFLPILRESEGFVAYYLLPAEDKLGAISMYGTAEQAAASTEAASAFVAENLAPFLPNPPQVVEGAVDISFVGLIDGMAEASPSSLHASVRVYDGFATDDVPAFVATVTDGFLPIARGSEGFFGYYHIYDGADTRAAISIFDRAESAAASNAQAADFVAENLAPYLPNPPSITSGSLGVAALAAVDGGRNLIETPAFASVRVYDGIDPADQAEIARTTAAGFLPIMRESPGFVAYYLLPAEDALAAISIMDSAEQAAASTEAARDFVAENLAPFLPNAPAVVEGTVDIGFVEMIDGMADMDASSLHASVRVYDGFAADDLDAFVTTVEDGFLPIMRATEGFFGYYLLHDDAGKVSAISIFDTAESAANSNAQAADFVAANLTRYLPNPPGITSGSLGVAALAELDMGANLIGAAEA